MELRNKHVQSKNRTESIWKSAKGWVVDRGGVISISVEATKKVKRGVVPKEPQPDKLPHVSTQEVDQSGPAL